VLRRPAGPPGNAADELSATPSASSSQFFTLSWPSPSSSSNPRQRGCHWCGNTCLPGLTATGADGKVGDDSGDPFSLRSSATDLGRGAASLASSVADGLSRGADDMSSGPAGLSSDADCLGSDMIVGFESDPSIGDAFLASQASATSGAQRRRRAASTKRVRDDEV
jgi:hypothetical protein